MRSFTRILGFSSAMLMAACGNNTGLPEESNAETSADPAASARQAQDLTAQVFSSSDPSLEYAKLSTADRRMLDAAMTPSSFEVSSIKIDGDIRTFSGCWAMHATGKTKNSIGGVLYTYWQTTNVCVSGGKVSSISVTDVGGETSTPGWRIDKNPSTSTKNVGWEGRGKAQYYFVLGAGGWDVQHPTTCLQLRLNADGSHYLTNTSCDIAS